MDIVELFTANTNDSFKTELKFKVCIIIIIVLFIFTRIFYNTDVLKGIFVVLVLGFGVYLSGLYINVVDEDINNQNKIIDYKLNSLQEKVYDFIKYKIDLTNNTKDQKSKDMTKKDTTILFKKNELNSLYIDANVIVFLYSIIKLYEYNKYEFYLLLKGTNNILKIRREIEEYYNSNGKHMQNIQEMFEIALQLKTNCINSMHNFIYSVPKMKIMYTYLEDCIVAYNKLMTNNLDKIHVYVNEYIKETGINTQTRFISYKQTKPFDQISNYSIIPNKTSNKKLIDLYV